MVTDKVLTDALNRDAKTTQRKCRRLIEKHGLKAELGGERGATTELYCWAAVAVLCEAGEVELGVMRRGAKNEAQKCANDWGQDTTRDSFWFLKLKEGALYNDSTADGSAEWASSRPRVGVQSGVLAADLYELRRRIRAVGADPLAHPEAQIYRTNAQLTQAVRGVRNFIPHRKALIALSVEIAAGRIATDGGLPSAAEVRRMTHGSSSLPRGSFGLTVA